MRPSKLPILRDEDSVKTTFARWLESELVSPQSDEEYADLMWNPEIPIRRPPDVEPNDRDEIEEARRGNLRPLAELVRDKERRRILSDESYQILADLLEGRRRRRQRHGRPRKTRFERDTDPARLALREMPRALMIIRKNYPRATEVLVRDAAIDALGRMYRVSSISIKSLMDHKKRR